MPNRKQLSVVVLALGLTACARGGAVPQASNGMVPYDSQGEEADAIAAGVSPKTVAAASASRKQAQITQNDCVQKEGPWRH